MKKFILPLALFTLACTQSQAQTKRIAHRSHSGADQHFSLTGSDNFGNPREDWKNVQPLPVADTAKAGTEGAKTVHNRKKMNGKKMSRRQKKEAAKGPK
jgi:hypothetical protein